MYLTPEEQQLLLGELREGDETAPLTSDETEAIGAQLGTFPVAENGGSKVDDVMAGRGRPVQLEPPAPEAPAEEPAPESPPAQTPTPAPAAQPAPIKQAPVLAQTKGDESKLVQTGPQWYDYVAPPKIDGSREAAGSIFGGFLSALTADSAKEGMGRFFGGLGQAAQAGISAPQRDYQNKLDAASKQAGMVRALNSGAGGDGLAAARLDLAERKYASQQAEHERKLALERALGDLNSPETRAQQDSAIAIGLPEKQARQMTGAQLLKWRTGLQGAVRQDEGQANVVSNMGRRKANEMDLIDYREGYKREGEERAEGRKIEGEQRDQEVKRQGAEIPRFELIVEQAPDNATVNNARRMAGATDRAVRAARNLQDLQNRINLLPQAGGNWYKVFGKDEDQKKILSRMQVWQNQLAAAQREIFHQGVPQQFEMTVNAKTNPEADSPLTFFTGANNWEAMESIMQEQGDAEMEYLGYRRARPIETGAVGGGGKPKNAASEIRKAGAEGKQVVSDAADAAGAVVDNARGNIEAAAPTARKLLIQIQDPTSKAWSSAREVTVEQYRALMKKLAEKGLGPGLVRKAQQ